MKRRGGKREGAGRNKSPVLTKITREINQKHCRTNHHYIYLKNRIFQKVPKVRVEGMFVNGSNFTWLLGLETKTSFDTQSIISSTRTTSSRTLLSTDRASALAMTWVWFLNLDSGEVVETKL